MQKILDPTTHVMHDREKKALLVISPIIIGSVAYGISAGLLVLNHMLELLF